MKSTLQSLAALMLVAMAGMLPSCKENPYYNSPSDNSFNGEPVVLTAWWDDVNGLVIPAGVEVISVDSAKKVCAALGDGKQSSQEYYVMGLVHSIVDRYSSVESATFYMVDKPSEVNAQFEGFRLKNIGGGNFASMEEVTGLRGSWVVIKAKLTLFGTTPETVQSGQIIARTYHKVKTKGDGSLEKPYNVADILKLGRGTEEEVYVKAYIRGVIGKNGFELEPTDGRFSKNTNLILADNLDEIIGENMIAVELLDGSGIREGMKLGVAANTDKYWGQEVILKGKIGTYKYNINNIEQSITAVKDPSYAACNGDEYTK